MNKININYLNYIENILANNKFSNNDKKIIIIKLLKIITSKIQIYYNEKVLFSKIKSPINKSTQYFPSQILDSFYENNQIELEKPVLYSLNETPIFSYIWRSDRIIRSFLNIGIYGFKTEKQLDIISSFIYPLGIVICSQNNHSTNSGIFNKNAESQITHILDISKSVSELKIEEKLNLKSSLKNRKIIKNIVIKEPIKNINLYHKPNKIVDCEEIILLIKITQLFLKYNFSLSIDDINNT